MKKIVSCRIELDWAKQLNDLAEEKGVSVACLMQDAIAAYLGEVSANAISTHEKRIAALERKFQRLSG